MDEGRIETVEARKLKDSILKELIDAYKESGAIYKKSSNPEIRQTMLDMKRAFDRAIERLSPSDAYPENLLEELRSSFSS